MRSSKNIKRSFLVFVYILVCLFVGIMVGSLIPAVAKTSYRTAYVFLAIFIFSWNALLKKMAKRIALVKGVAVDNQNVHTQSSVEIHMSSREVITSRQGVRTSSRGSLEPVGSRVTSDGIKDVDTALDAFETYKRENTSTKEVRELIDRGISALNSFRKQYKSVRKVLSERHESWSEPYHKFMASVDNSSDKMVVLAKNLIIRYESFDEEDYFNKIARFKETGKDESAEKFQNINNEYLKYAEEAISAMEDISIKLDSLVLELTKIAGNESSDLEAALESLDILISETDAYRY